MNISLPVPEKEVLSQKKNALLGGGRVAATWEVKRAGKLGIKETLSPASGASHFSWLLCCNDGAHPTTTASQCIRSMTISSYGSAGHERPQGRQLVPKLWVWLGWALHQAFATIVHTEHWLMRKQLPRGSSFQGRGRRVRRQTYFCLPFVWHPNTPQLKQTTRPSWTSDIRHAFLQG